ncbi:MAG: GTPase Era [candidate division KSB1 bacterium]|nr:GTPase Era [candidate division KSB1 bacterium]MDZ7303391.1 GTPase Era [candidate division KSB1 bacterium]MDZ7312291.1 GTPase Era [candidate division KSB1 bacterium]
MKEKFVEILTISPESRTPTSSSFSDPTNLGQHTASAVSSTFQQFDQTDGKSGKTLDSVKQEPAAKEPQNQKSHLVLSNVTQEGQVHGQAQTSTIPFKAGYVAIVGQPNVGKSTLLNALLHFKLAIVSPKPQTTRKRILGILNRPRSQMVFFDTPGIIEAHYRLQQALVRAAYQAIKEADVQILMVEPRETSHPADLAILNRLADTGKPIIVTINKIDTVPKDNLLPVIAAFGDKRNVKEIVPISALHQDGTERLAEVLEKYLPEQEPFYDSDQITNHPERFLAAEIVREKIFLRYGEEIPYSTSVQIEDFVERPGHKDFIRAVIYVERESQKGIMIGKGGQALKQVGKLAREELEQLLGRPVYLELYVAVKEKWRERESELRNLGYL